MSLLGAAEGVVETATGTRWIRLALRLAPWIVIAGLAAALQITRATLHGVRDADTIAEARRERDGALQEASNANRLVAAADAYAARSAALKPLIVRSTDTVRSYAETPAGRVACRDAGRVRDVDALDASLASPGSAQGGADAVRADATASPAGR